MICAFKRSPLLILQPKSRSVSHHGRMSDGRSLSEQPLSIIFHSSSQETPFLLLPQKKKQQVSSAVIFGSLFSPDILLVSQKALSRPAPSNSQIKRPVFLWWLPPRCCLSCGPLPLSRPPSLFLSNTNTHTPPIQGRGFLSSPANETPAGGPAVNTNALIVKSTISQPKQPSGCSNQDLEGK